MKIPKELAEHIDQLPSFMTDTDKIDQFVNNLDVDIDSEDKATIKLNLLFVLMGVKDFQYLPMILLEDTSINPDTADYISRKFLTDIIEPIGYDYYAVILRIINEDKIDYDPEEALVLKEIVKMQQKSHTIGEIAVPKPPKYVSPKVEVGNTRIENIRPKPHQGADDPYREAVE